MSIIITERPGIFSHYELSTLTAAASRQAVGLAAVPAFGTAVTRCGSLAEVVESYGQEDGTGMAALAARLFAEGVSTVVCSPVQADDYAAAFANLEDEADIGAVICDNTASAVHSQMKTSVHRASDEGYERVGILAVNSDATSALTAAAAAVGSERMALAAPAIDGSSLYTAAILAAIVVRTADPAALAGESSLQVGTVATRYTRSQLDTLIQGGVSPFEAPGGVPSLVRAISTRTQTDGMADKSWRNLAVILIIDRVLSGLRAALRSRLRGGRNNERTRGAIQAQTAILLEGYRTDGLIDGYDPPEVAASTDDPTVAVVTVGFAVALGINQIHILAHVTV